MSTKAVADEIKKRLTEAGVFVEVYNSYSTNSVYLCFDRGVLKSARVGDHKGKKKYHYTYEIGSHVGKYAEVKGVYMDRQFTRYRYPEAAVEDLITEVLIMRSNLRAKYGKENYPKLTSNSSFPGRKK